MKKAITYGGEELVIKCVAMSHSSVGGEYEIKISKKLDLDLERLSKNISSSDYRLEWVKDRSVSLNHNNAAITILKKGNILIQDLLPDTYEEAIKITEELINAEQMGEK